MNKLLLFVFSILVLGLSAMRLSQIDNRTAEIINAINRSQPDSSHRMGNVTPIDAVTWDECATACQRNPMTLVQCIGT